MEESLEQKEESLEEEQHRFTSSRSLDKTTNSATDWPSPVRLMLILELESESSISCIELERILKCLF